MGVSLTGFCAFIAINRALWGVKRVFKIAFNGGPLSLLIFSYAQSFIFFGWKQRQAKAHICSIFTSKIFLIKFQINFEAIEIWRFRTNVLIDKLIERMKSKIRKNSINFVGFWVDVKTTKKWKNKKQENE